MSIKKIDKNELRGYEGKEGLILQGCGGNPQEWVDGINDLFTKEGILLEGTKFSDDNCAVFENNGLTCLLYEFNDDTKVDIGKLAMWRIGTHSDLGGTWLSDYVENKLGGFSLTGTKKPDCPLIGQNGNIFNLMGIAARTLRHNGLAEQSKEMTRRITDTAQSYDEALGIMVGYRESCRFLRKSNIQLLIHRKNLCHCKKGHDQTLWQTCYRLQQTQKCRYHAPRLQGLHFLCCRQRHFYFA